MNKRFQSFASRLLSVLGDRAYLLANGKVSIDANEFTPKRVFADLQSAIDHFSYIPEMIVSAEVRPERRKGLTNLDA